MFPWGKGELEGQSLDAWQSNFLDQLGKELRAGEGPETQYLGEAIQKAVASGHGIGKSCLISILILWALSTMEDARGVVTANTSTQLTTKTWPELGKWHRLFMGKELFIYTATSIYFNDKYSEAGSQHEKTWRIDAVTWTKERSEAFAGLHNQNRRVILFFDEASAIDDKIWEVSEGALTDANTEIIWLAFGNPTRNTGRFHACFHKLRHRWKTQQIDSRTVRITNKSKFQKWVDDYGEDSDFVRIRVRGIFPRQGDRQFFSADLLEQARQRGLTMNPNSQRHMPNVISLDSAWTGGDEVVCGHKRGLFIRMAWVQAKNDDDVELATRFAQTEIELHADAQFIDFGYGTGVYSVGKHIGRKWQLIKFGGEPTDKRRWKNKRAEMYDTLRTLLKEGGALADDPKLIEELAALEEVYRDDGVIQLESKDDFIERTGYSPGRADAAALLCAGPVKMKDEWERAGVPKPRPAQPDPYDPTERRYNPFDLDN